ncbi:ketose-bisphosphate aldolase [Microdochium trichocladiopsis]|uniref:Fructose-bisphosphate aldolase n=1 Tax=Microdochium trichocladiopsis TaxID=1682393 RepID=A0A9P9BMV9_9PEZI|nr:ketose-bisphosphate aldolase [Microdochium trichocladiopsis]KAH7018197.1 ketose-bisphosphate aldolase [Microdochium trichocladiopsis]
MEWKKDNKTFQILKAAEEGQYGVVAPIAYNIECILGFIRAAEKKRSPLILQVFPWAITFSGGLLVHAAAHAARNASVPVAIHLDHAQDEDLIRHAAADLPFDSIMVDMSHHEMDENLAKTKELVAFCNQHEVTTEAEPGRIEGGEDGIADTADLEGKLTTPEQVDDFVATGIDFLAPAFGNVHGEYNPARGGPVLEYDRLRSIRERLKKAAAAKGRDVRVVLHGTNGFPEDVMKKCIAGGCTKINVNKLVLDDYLAHMRANAATQSLTAYMEQGVEEIQRLTEWQMDVCGSTGKA